MARTGSNNKRNQKYEVVLNDEQISFLKALLSMNETTLTIKKRALILLALHKDSGKNLTHRQIAESLDVSISTVHCTVKRFVDLGLMNVLRFTATPDKTTSAKYRGISRPVWSNWPVVQLLKAIPPGPCNSCGIKPSNLKSLSLLP